MASNIYDLDTDKKQQLYLKLQAYLSEGRMDHFDRVIAQRSRHLAVGLEDVFKDNNTGAIARSCDCFGIQDLYVIEDHHQLKVAEATAMGSTKWVDINIIKDDQKPQEKAVSELKAKGYKVVSMTPADDALDLGELPLEDPIVFFFGAEKVGISDRLAALSDFRVKIPMRGFTESFNVSVSCAITLDRCTRRMREENINWQLSQEEKIDLLIQWSLSSIREGERIAHYILEEMEA